MFQKQQRVEISRDIHRFSPQFKLKISFLYREVFPESTKGNSIIRHIGLLRSLNQMLTEMMRGENHWCFFNAGWFFILNSHIKPDQGYVFFWSYWLSHCSALFLFSQSSDAIKEKSEGYIAIVQIHLRILGGAEVLCFADHTKWRYILRETQATSCKSCFTAGFKLEVLLIVVTTIFHKP